MLSVQEFGCIGQACLDVFLTDVRIVVQDLLLGPAGGKKVDDELDGEPCAFDDWFANKDLGVDRYAFAPVQCHRFQDTSRARTCPQVWIAYSRQAELCSYGTTSIIFLLEETAAIPSIPVGTAKFRRSYVRRFVIGGNH